jgi:hypothetical protein
MPSPAPASPAPAPTAPAPPRRLGSPVGRIVGRLVAWLGRLVIGPESVSPRRPPGHLHHLPRHLLRDIGLDRDRC